MCLKPNLDLDTYEYWRCAVGTCGRALAGNIPVLSAYYDMMIGESDEVEIEPDGSGFQMLAHGMTNDRVVTDHCRVSFMKAFGIMPHQQLAMEAFLRAQPLATANWHLPGGTYTPWTTHV